MSRQRPSDAFTRFTSTAPSSSRPQPTPTSVHFSQPSARPLPASQSPHASGSPGETAAERVARLRASRRAGVPLSFSDRLISRGRTWADIAHRLTTYSLLAFTGVSSVVAVYGIVSLVSHNRRQKRAWIEREMGRLDDARAAFLKGEANAEQLHLLEQERAGEEMAKKYQEDQQKKKDEGVWRRIKGTFGSFAGRGYKGVDNGLEKTQLPSTSLSQRTQAEGLNEAATPAGLQRAAVEASGIRGVGLDSKGRPVPINKLERVSNAIEQERRTSEREITARTGITGGPLDVLADNIAQAVAPSSHQTDSGWWSWVTRSGGSGGRPSSSSV